VKEFFLNQDNLALVANPELAAQITGNGGQLPNLAAAAAAAVAEQQKKLLESVVGGAVTVLEALNAHVTNKVNERARLNAQVAELDKDISKASTARAYFDATNNLFPAMKVCGIPIKADVLARNPGIDNVPANWTAPAASAS
jgi:hypothetical protein